MLRFLPRGCPYSGYDFYGGGNARILEISPMTIEEMRRKTVDGTLAQVMERLSVAEAEERFDGLGLAPVYDVRNASTSLVVAEEATMDDDETMDEELHEPRKAGVADKPKSKRSRSEGPRIVRTEVVPELDAIKDDDGKTIAGGITTSILRKLRAALDAPFSPTCWV